jgi:hypothetical protein
MQYNAAMTAMSLNYGVLSVALVNILNRTEAVRGTNLVLGSSLRIDRFWKRFPG